jgi:hypothetical protein
MKRSNSLNNNKNSFLSSAPKFVAVGLFFSCAAMSFFGTVLRASADDASTVSVAPIVGTDDGSLCTPNPALFAQIKTIQNNPALGYLDEIKAELVVRKQLLTDTITCAANESKALKTSLMAVKTNQDFITFQSQLAGQLDEAAAYYDLETQKVSTAGLSGTENIAKDVLSWRKSNYAPLAENVSNFISWSGNQAVFGVAENRLEQVKSLIGSVPFSENAELQDDFQEAVVSLQSAQDENAKAGQAFEQSLSPDQTLALIQQSLSDLAATYQHFFDISNLVQTLLPH